MKLPTSYAVYCNTDTYCF